MRFLNTAPKLSAVISKDKDKVVITEPHFNQELGELQATDTYVAVRIPVEAERGDSTGVVPISDLEAARKAKHGSLKTPKRSKAKKDAPKPFPDLVPLWPSDKEIDKAGFSIGINAQLLKNVADALGSETGNVELIFPAYSKDGWPQALRPIIVRAANDTGVKRDDGEGVEVAEALLRPVVFEVAEAEADHVLADPDSVADGEGLVMPVKISGKSVATTAASKRSSAGSTAKKPSSAGSAAKGTTASRSQAANKAWETRRANAEAKKGTKANGKGDITTAAGRRANSEDRQAAKSKAAIAAKVAAVASGKPKPKRASGRAAGKGNGNGDFGAGSDRRRQAAAKAAETRRKNLAAAAK